MTKSWKISINQCTDIIALVSVLLPGTLAGEAMGGPPSSHAFIMVGTSFANSAILFYLASNANKNKWEDNLNNSTIVLSIYYPFLVTKEVSVDRW